MQGSTSGRQLLRRLRSVGSLFVGLYVGAVVLFVALVGLQRSVGALVPTALESGLVALAAASLFVADIWSVARSRLCPLSRRRQAVKSLLYRGHRSDYVGFVWGFDVGLGVTTFRVTTGIWLVLALVVLGALPAWTAFVFVGAFSAALVTVTLLPTSLTASADDRMERSLRRILWLGEHRRWAQATYLFLTPFAVASLLYTT